MGRKKEFTDKQIKEALIKANGQPTKAAEILGMVYPHLYTRIRKNPELLEIQKAYRARTFNDVSNSITLVAMAGIIREPVTDENGVVISGKFKEVAVDSKTRLSAMQTILTTFKSDEGISDKIEVTTTGSVSISQWLEANSQPTTEEEA